jgi:hypothetical protein
MNRFCATRKAMISGDDCAFDHSQIGVCAITDVATLVTDPSADPAGVEAIRRAGTEVIVTAAAGQPAGTDHTSAIDGS